VGIGKSDAGIRKKRKPGGRGKRWGAKIKNLKFPGSPREAGHVIKISETQDSYPERREKEAPAKRNKEVTDNKRERDVGSGGPDNSPVGRQDMGADCCQRHLPRWTKVNKSHRQNRMPKTKKGDNLLLTMTGSVVALRSRKR